MIDKTTRSSISEKPAIRDLYRYVANKPKGVEGIDGKGMIKTPPKNFHCK